MLGIVLKLTGLFIPEIETSAIQKELKK